MLSSLAHECAHIFFHNNELDRRLPQFENHSLTYEGRVGFKKEEEEIYAELMSLLVMFDGYSGPYAKHYLENLSAHLEFGEKLLLHHPDATELTESIVPAFLDTAGRTEKFHRIYLGRFLATQLYLNLLFDLSNERISADDRHNKKAQSALVTCLDVCEKAIAKHGKKCLISNEWRRMIADAGAFFRSMEGSALDFEDMEPRYASVAALAQCVVRIYKEVLASHHQPLINGRSFPRTEPSEEMQDLDPHFQLFIQGKLELDTSFDPTLLMYKLCRWAAKAGEDTTALPNNPLQFNAIMAIEFALADCYDKILLRNYCSPMNEGEQRS
jgi:hypothetical protein